MSTLFQYSSFINEAELDDAGVANVPPIRKKAEKKLMKLFLSPRLIEVLEGIIKTGDFQAKTIAEKLIHYSDKDNVVEYCCSDHPNEKSDKSGKCPVCNKDFKSPGFADVSYIDLAFGKDDFITFMPTDKAWRAMGFQNQTEANQKPAPDNPMWTAAGRQPSKVSALINRLFDDFTPLAVDKFIKTFKAEVAVVTVYDRFKLVKGEDIRYWYSEKRYAPNDGRLMGGSCMRYDNPQQTCQPFLEIYVKNPEKCSLLIYTNADNKLMGRALVWTNLRKPYGETFMDRIYIINQADEELFKKYAKEHGWLYKRSQTAQDFTYMQNGKEGKDKITIKLHRGEYPSYPFMDTLCYYTPKSGRLSSYMGHKVEGRPRLKCQRPGGTADRAD